MDPITGGPCQGIRNLNKALVATGAVYREIICMDDPNSPYLGSDDFIVHAMGTGKTAWGYNQNLYPWLVRNLERFDIVIINGVWLYHEYAAIKAMKRLQRKKKLLANGLEKIPQLYIMPHGMLDPYFQQAPERKLKAIRNWLYWMLIERKNISSASGLLFTCETELQLARKTFRFYRPQKEINIGYGIEDVPKPSGKMNQAFLETCPGLEERSYYLFLSRIHPKKGVAMLINAYLEIIKKPKPENQQQIPALVIAGPGLETQYCKELQNFVIKDPALQNHIYFPGMLAGDAKWGAFYGCDAFILPSHQENFGIAIVEALACKKPVLISDKVNIWAEISEEQAGFVKQDTLAGTIELLQLWTDLPSGEKKQMSENARKCFEQKFSITTVAKRFISELHPA